MADSLSVGAIVDAIEKLFGKVGAAVLIATIVFFWFPAPVLSLIGVNNSDPALRHACGIALLLSAAACLVTISLKIWPWLRDKFSQWGRDRSIYRLYLSLDHRARALIAHFELSASSRHLALRGSNATQDLIDAGIMMVVGHHADGKVVVLDFTSKGRRYIALHRPTFRGELAANLASPESIEEELSKVTDLVRYGI